MGNTLFLGSHSHIFVKAGGKVEFGRTKTKYHPSAIGNHYISYFPWGVGTTELEHFACPSLLRLVLVTGKYTARVPVLMNDEDKRRPINEEGSRTRRAEKKTVLNHPRHHLFIQANANSNANGISIFYVYCINSHSYV